MRKILVLFLTGIFTVCMQGKAQVMKDMVLSMPDSVMPLLSKDNKADFIDFLANKMQAKVKNAFNEYSYMDTLTNDYTHIRLTPCSDVSIKLLPLTDSTKVICLVHTYRADAAESNVSFFDTNWKGLDGKSFVDLPSVDDFVKPAGDDSLALVRGKLDVSMIAAHLSARDNELKFTFDDAYLPQEDKKQVNGCILPEIVKKWDKGRFVSK